MADAKSSLNEPVADGGELVERFRVRMERPDIASELFLPIRHAYWHRGRLRVHRVDSGEIRSQISGLRLHAADPLGEDPGLERQVQQDVVSLLRSLVLLRREPGMERLVLSRDLLMGRTSGVGGGTRVKFGLEVDPRGKYGEDVQAARVCHRRIVRAVRRAGFRIEHPAVFDVKTGLEGLIVWAGQLRLRKRRPVLPWLLLLPLILLLLLLLRDCRGPMEFFGVSLRGGSWIVLVDKSSSMEPHFAAVQVEAKRVLGEVRRRGSRQFADVIAYDGEATSALGGLARVDDESSARLSSFLEGLSAGGDTRLERGVALAAEEVVAHGQPTTLIILTDGEDESIQPMIDKKEETLGRFGGIRVAGYTLTPRLFGGAGPADPQNDSEQRLKAFAEVLTGRFGPEEDR